MKKNIITQIMAPALALLFCLMLVAGKIAAQTTDEGPKLCSGGTIDTAALRKALDYEANGAVLRAATSSSSQVRIYFHILTNDDGTNAGATLAQITQEFAVLGYDYSLGNICFINCGYDYVNSTKLNTNFTVGADNFDLYNPYLVPSCINIFYPATILGNNNACTTDCGIGGVTPTIPATFTLISRGNIGAGQTISHEVGHCLGLLHTFEPANGVEDINGSNSSSAADQIQDTPADPWTFNQTGNSCFATSGGNYTGNCTDPNGQSNYSPPYANLMAYWWASRPATELATTSGQFTRVNSYLSSNSGLQACESSQGNGTIPSGTISSGYKFLSSFASMSNTNGAASNFTGSVKAGFFASSILLHPGFNAAPGSGGSLEISATNCSFAPAGPADASDGLVTTGVSSPTDGDEQIQIMPNPFNSSFQVSINVNQGEQASIIIYNALGAEVKTLKEQSLTAGNNRISFDCSDFASGIYFVEIKSGNTRTVKKIVKS